MSNAQFKVNDNANSLPETMEVLSGLRFTKACDGRTLSQEGDVTGEYVQYLVSFSMPETDEGPVYDAFGTVKLFTDNHTAYIWPRFEDYVEHMDSAKSPGDEIVLSCGCKGIAIEVDETLFADVYDVTLDPRYIQQYEDKRAVAYEVMSSMDTDGLIALAESLGIDTSDYPGPGAPTLGAEPDASGLLLVSTN